MDIYTYIISIIIGIILGTLTGLIPGVHINLIASIILGLSPILINIIPVMSLICCIISIGITHSFIDFIPSLLFGIPNADTALSILPGHKMVIEGKGLDALYLSGLGSFGGTLLAFLLFFPLYYTLLNAYETISPYIPYILLSVSIFLILLEHKIRLKILALIISCFAGAFGLLLLNTIHTKQPLLILFTGIFGVASLIFALENETKSPRQELTFDKRLPKNYFKGLFLGGISATICSVSPGLGNSQAATISSLFLKFTPPQLFIVILSSINTIGFIISIITYYLLERARNGSIIVISQLLPKFSISDIIVFFSVIFVTTIISFYLLIKIGRVFIKISNIIPERKVNIGIIVMLICLVYYLTNWIGIIYLIAGSALGYLGLTFGVRRVHLLNCLLFVVVLNLM